MPRRAGKGTTDRLAVWENLPGSLPVHLGPGAEPSPAPADLQIPPVNKQQEEETPEAPSALEKALQTKSVFRG